MYALRSGICLTLYSIPVSPKLRMGPLQERLLAGNVSTTFANPYYLSDNCPALIHGDVDPDYKGTTCLDMQHVGQAYHSYQMYLGQWGGRRTSSDLDRRPLPMGSLNDNTTLTGSWIERTNLTELSQKHGRLVNNVTAAMPHGGILSVTTYEANQLPDPQSLSGEGNFELEASVLVPAVNVLCVGMNKSELAPLVYTEWPDVGDKFDAVKWTNDPPDNIPVYPNWLNRTIVDDLFGWGPKYGQRPPVFGKLPLPYNTLLNTTGRYPANSIYLLGRHRGGFEPPVRAVWPEGQAEPALYHAVQRHGQRLAAGHALRGLVQPVAAGSAPSRRPRRPVGARLEKHRVRMGAFVEPGDRHHRRPGQQRATADAAGSLGDGPGSHAAVGGRGAGRAGGQHVDHELYQRPLRTWLELVRSVAGNAGAAVVPGASSLHRIRVGQFAALARPLLRHPGLRLHHQCHLPGLHAV